MRTYSGRNAILLLPLLFGIPAHAEEASDRTAILSTIAALNHYPQRTDIFTADPAVSDAVENLWKGKRMTYGLQQQPDTLLPAPSRDHPTVTISHEPWGEATLNFPGDPAPPQLEAINPRIAGGPIRFQSADVAVVSGTCTYVDESGLSHRTSLRFVMKREGALWKIASLGIVAPA